MVGDRVEITVNAQGENTIDTILPRKNELRRPPLANLDRLFIVSSLVDPEIRTVQIDKLTVLAAQKGIDCVIVLTKADLAENWQQYADIYKTAGYPVVLCNARSGAGADELPALISGKLCAFTGNSGVGKSTLARCLLAGHTPCGFRTVRVTGVLDRPSVHLLPAVGGVPSAENLLFYCGAYSCERFDTLGTAALRDRDGDVLLMDELGPAESGAKKFCEAVLAALDGDLPILGVLQKADTEFLRAVAGHPRVRLVTVTVENRDELRHTMTF